MAGLSRMRPAETIDCTPVAQAGTGGGRCSARPAGL